MADDMKLSVDVSADLSKLDSSLMVAQQKVAAAGRSMQQSVSFSPGMLGAGSLPSQFQSPPSNFVTFGNSGLNASYGNAAQIIPGRGLPGNVMRPGGGAGAGGAGGGWMGDAYATLRGIGMGAVAGVAVARGATSFLEGSAKSYSAQNSIRMMEANRRASPGSPEFYGSINNLYQTSGARDFPYISSIPLVGDLLTGVDMAYRNNEMQMNISSGGHGANYGGREGTASAIREMSLKNSMGVFGGGYKGMEETQNYNSKLREIDRMNRITSGSATDTQITQMNAQNAQANKRELGEIDFTYNQQMKDISSATGQNRLRAMGLGKFADLQEITRSFRQPIDLARSQGGTRNLAVAKAMEGQRDSAIMAAMLGNTQAAQVVSPTLEAVGNVRLGTMNDQNSDFLKQIAHNTAATPTATVGRN